MHTIINQYSKGRDTFSLSFSHSLFYHVAK